MEIRFSKPDVSKNTVSVHRILADNSSQIIGEVWQDSTVDDESPVYISTNKLGETIMPPTSNFNEIEERFNEYAKELTMQEFTQAMMEEADRIHERTTIIKTIRHNKVRDGLSQQII